MNHEDILKKWIEADAYIESTKKELREIKFRYEDAIAKAQDTADQCRAQLDDYMTQNGIVEDITLGDMTNIKIAYSSRENVVIDDEAVPDDYIIHKPQINKKLINEDMKELREAGQPLPNWAKNENTTPLSIGSG